MIPTPTRFSFRTERYAWAVVALLCFGATVSMLDRQVLVLLVEPIKKSLQISDTGISLLQGFAVAIFYALLAVPLGRLSDIGNRRNIIAAGALLFSLSTIAGGFALSFGALFATRLCVGIGEATLTPAGTSLIGDYLPPQKTGRAMGFFVGATFAGSGLSLVAIGGLIAFLSAHPEMQFALIGRPEDWQLVFIAAGLPGIVFALAMMAVREPPRGDGLILSKDAISPSAGIGELIAFIRAHLGLLVSIFLGLPILAAGQFGINVWTPTFFIRTYGWTPSEIGPVFGLMVVVLSTSGVVVGGWISDWMLERGRIDANLLVPMVTALCAMPFILAFPLAGSAHVSLALLAPALFLGAMPFGAGPTAIPLLAPNRLRAQLMAIYMFFGNLIGAGLGPWMIAAFTDGVIGDPQSIRFSMAIVGTCVVLSGALVVGLGAWSIRMTAQARRAL
jgi:MFS family permease